MNSKLANLPTGHILLKYQILFHIKNPPHDFLTRTLEKAASQNKHKFTMCRGRLHYVLKFVL